MLNKLSDWEDSKAMLQILEWEINKGCNSNKE